MRQFDDKLSNITYKTHSHTFPLYLQQFFKNMNIQQYAGHAVNYAGYYLNAAKQLWWPTQQIPTTPVQLFRFNLQNSKFQFKTKHTDQKIVIERLCMMYNQMLAENSKKYNKFRPTIEKPIEYVQPNPNNKLQNKLQQQKQHSLVSIIGDLKIKGTKINCTLTITLTFHENIQQQLPFLYIRNPDPQKTQSNPQYVTNQTIYQPILGGVTLSKKQKQNIQKEWKQYKPYNMLILMKRIQNLLSQKFPFVKRYIPFQKIDIEGQQYKRLINLNERLHRSLQQTQQLIILKESIGSEYQNLKNQNKKLEVQFQNIQKFNIKQWAQNFKIQQNEELLELICIQKASLDCLRYIENCIQGLNKDENCYQEYVELVKEWSTRLFQVRFKIKQIMQLLEDQMQTRIQN